MKRIFSQILPSAGVLAALMVAPALAQQTNSESAATTDDEEIVVTGTSIRGVAPAGGQTIGLDADDVATTGATSSVQLLATIPQLSEFNGLPSVLSTTSASQQAANRPAVRGLTSGASGASPTLILMDGHRLPGAGIVQTAADPDVVPASAIQRVEIVTDGGSSIYGADAVGGVINFITRKSFEGLEFNVRQGFGDEFQTTDGYITGGTSWTGGSAYASYNYAQHDAIYGRDRDYVRRLTYDPSSPLVGLPTGRSCGDGTISVGGQDYNIDNSGGSTDFTLGDNASVRCDLSDGQTIYPQERRDSYFAGLNQELTDTLSFDFRAWYTNRVSKNDRSSNFSGSTDNSRVITAANNNYFQCITCLPGEQQTVYFNYGSIADLDTIARVELESWGFSPSLTWDIGHDWQARGFLNYGLSNTRTRDPAIDNTVLVDNFANINFYNIGASDPAIVQALITENIALAQSEDEIVNGRVVVDGPLMTLPGGEVRAAFGAEYLGERYEVFQNDTTDGDTRRSRALFAELSVPLVQASNNVPLIHSLDLSLSARHDMYSDFGAVTTPRVGITYEPWGWLSVRGNWGKSFQAPSLADTAQNGTTLGSGTATSVLQFALPFTVPNPSSDRLMVIQGAAPLDAQRAETYSVGFDIRPPMIENLELSTTYYNIEYTGQIGSPPVFLPTFYSDPGTAQFFLLNQTTPGAAISEPEIRAYLQSRGVSQDDIDEAVAGIDPSTDVTLIVDFRRRNLGSVKLSGIDASVRYTADTDFGSIYFNASGTYRLNEQIDVTGLGFGSNAAGDTLGSPRWNATATVGATVGEHFRGQAQLFHSPAQDIAPIPATNFQDQVDAFDVVNLFFQYDMLGTGLTEDLSFTLGVNNVLDNDPSAYNGSTFTTQGYVGGNLGRVVQVGVTKTF